MKNNLLEVAIIIKLILYIKDIAYNGHSTNFSSHTICFIMLQDRLRNLKALFLVKIEKKDVGKRICNLTSMAETESWPPIYILSSFYNVRYLSEARGHQLRMHCPASPIVRSWPCGWVLVNGIRIRVISIITCS